jgi:ribosomal protein L37AE/L43A
MYYIYHIPGEKIGCTMNYPERPASQSDNYELLETHTDIYVASERETELQKEYGLRCRSNTPYYVSMERARVAASKSATSPNRFGATLSEDHKQKLHAHIGDHNKSKVECPHCSKVGQRAAMGRWHFDNCRNRH